MIHSQNSQNPPARSDQNQTETSYPCRACDDGIKQHFDDISIIACTPSLTDTQCITETTNLKCIHHFLVVCCLATNTLKTKKLTQNGMGGDDNGYGNTYSYTLRFVVLILADL